MAVGQPSALALFWRRYRVSIIFPVLSIGSIFADYSHTQSFKKSRRQAIASEELKD